MNEVLLINPRKKKRVVKRRAKKKTATTATKRRRRPTIRKRSARKTTTKRRAPAKRAAARTTTKRKVATMAKRRKRTTTRRKARPRRNPSSVKRYARRAARRSSSALRGLNFKGALKNVAYYQVGMFGSKWLAKRFGGGASEIDPESWGWKEYLQGALGAVATGFLAQMVKPGSGQKVMEGGLSLMVYEMIQNELITGNEWAASQFGEEEDYYGYVPGDVEQDETGRSYLLGEDQQWHELPESVQGSYGSLEPVGPLGSTLEPVGPLGSTLEPVGPLGADDPYRKALLDA